jgi:hypothetical protein
LKITIESTPTLTSIDGVEVRHWLGITEGGIPCHVFTRKLAVADDADSAEFDRELRRDAEPADMASTRAGVPRAIPLRMVF